ncbi:MAG: hypothetical protein EYR95_18535 [Phormidium sp. SL48-SHIP]|nr:MAG: hypothetical protein EYR95_18535 [Phormidium sp. SL48-SHIP]
MDIIKPELWQDKNFCAQVEYYLFRQETYWSKLWRENVDLGLKLGKMLSEKPTDEKVARLCRKQAERAERRGTQMKFWEQHLHQFQESQQ